MTNYEKIKNMNLTSLSRFIEKLNEDKDCNCCAYRQSSCINLSCRKGIKEWLNQEAEEKK
jgi:hypothetical protein